MLEQAANSTLLLILCALILLSGFFSSAETGMMSINRYRLKHLARLKKHFAARRTKRLLTRPDRLLGVILIGNTFANIMASSVATVLCIRWWGDVGVVIGALSLTLLVLIFAEIAPKTFAARNPERVAFFASWPLVLLLRLGYPIVWLGNTVANGLLWLCGLRSHHTANDALNIEELRTVVNEAGGHIPEKHQDMLLGILDLSDATVEDIMVPRAEIVGLDLEDDWAGLEQQLANSYHTRLPVFCSDIEQVEGFLHVRSAMKLFAHDRLSLESIRSALEPVHFIPEGTPLPQQLVNFQKNHSRSGLVVDEYGDIQGLVTLEDILEEVVGDFTTDIATLSKEVHVVDEQEYIIEGSIHVRKLNRMLQLELPTEGPRTLSGLLVEQLESIPRVGTTMRLNNVSLEVVQVKKNMIKTVRLVKLMSQDSLDATH